MKNIYFNESWIYGNACEMCGKKTKNLTNGLCSDCEKDFKKFI